MPNAIELKPLFEVKNPLGCHLQTINGTGGCFGWPTGAASFDALLKKNHGKTPFGGAYFSGTIVSIRIPDKKTVEELTKRGFKLLGTQKGGHGNYKMALYGLGFTLPKKGKEECES